MLRPISPIACPSTYGDADALALGVGVGGVGVPLGVGGVPASFAAASTASCAALISV